MKKFKAVISVFLFSILFISCKASENEVKFEDIVQPPTQEESSKHPLDMVLIYTGGSHRGATWDANHFSPYVGLTREDGTFDGLFDGFIFLELKHNERAFVKNFTDNPARKVEWKYLADHFFSPDVAVMGLEKELSNLKKSGKVGNFVDIMEAKNI